MALVVAVYDRYSASSFTIHLHPQLTYRITLYVFNVSRSSPETAVVLLGMGNVVYSCLGL
jgi:hypothetical protein